MSAAEKETSEGESVKASAHVRARVRHMPWYAVQVMVGREERMREAIMRAIELEQRLAEEQSGAIDDAQLPIVEELFVPKARVGVKQDGKWVPGEEVLLPGYLIAVCRDPAALERAMRRTQGFARIVRQDNAFIPLPEQSVKWLEEQTQRGGAAVEMSEGYVEDGVLHVMSGPLKGREADVVRVNHRRKVAYLQIEAFGRTITAQLGIRITRSRHKKTCQKNLKTE